MSVKKQQGAATLIIILIILLLVTLIGTLAIKSSTLGLRIATNSQIQTLLAENNDAILFKLTDPNDLSTQMAVDGVYGYFNNSVNNNHILAFCYDHTEQNIFSLGNASVINGSSVTGNGFCTNQTFSTARQVTITQVYLQKQNANNNGFFSNAAIGTSIGETNMPAIAYNIKATAISIMPSFVSNSELTSALNCLRQVPTNFDSCLTNAGVEIPHDIQHLEYKVDIAPRRAS